MAILVDILEFCGGEASEGMCCVPVGQHEECKEASEGAGMEPFLYRCSRRVGGFSHVKGRNKEGCGHLGLCHSLDDGNSGAERGGSDQFFDPV